MTALTPGTRPKPLYEYFGDRVRMVETFTGFACQEKTKGNSSFVVFALVAKHAEARSKAEAMCREAARKYIGTH